MQVVSNDTLGAVEGAAIVSVWPTPGWSLWPLVLCAVFAAIIIGRKLWELSVKGARTLRLLERIDSLLEQRMIAEALAAARESDTPGGRIIDAGLARRAAGSDRVARAIASVTAIENAALQHWLIPLATIAAVAPLFGFLGAALAAMAAIDAAAGPPALAASLVPAVVGLAIAIPVALMHGYIAARIERLLARIAESAHRAVEAIQAMEDRAPHP